MTIDIKAIQTRYAGCHFRSRLEARWAVFFDHCGIEWQYEPEGFQHTMHDRAYDWLPDFHLPATNTWVEVKGSDAQLRTDWHRLLCMIDWESPIPGVDGSWGTDRGVLLLGAIPRADAVDPLHPIAQHRKGVWLHAWSFFNPPQGGVVHVGPHNQSVHWPTEDDRLGHYFDSSWGSEHCFSLEGGEHIGLITEWTTRVRNAYKAARSARFEHGQSGAT